MPIVISEKDMAFETEASGDGLIDGASDEADETIAEEPESDEISKVETEPNTKESDKPEERLSETPGDLNQVNELSMLKSEIERLRGQLEEQQKSFMRMSCEVAEFSELFPGQSLASLPGEVWEGVKRGIPLAAAYAYESVRRERMAALAAEVNAKNSECSTGPVDGRGNSDFFTPTEVRLMSANEVRNNYKKIIDSMKLWS